MIDENTGLLTCGEREIIVGNELAELFVCFAYCAVIHFAILMTITFDSFLEAKLFSVV